MVEVVEGLSRQAAQRGLSTPVVSRRCSFVLSNQQKFFRGDTSRVANEVIMNEEPISDTTNPDETLLEVGMVLGQNYAFGLVAGRCSAAQAEALRRLRDERLYKRCSETCLDFCPKYLKMSKTEADRTIKLLEEFGPAYFELSQL